MQLKLVGQNVITYAMGNISLRIASFLLIPLYTHSLSISDYGLLITLLMTIQILISIIGLGTPIGFMRFAKQYERMKLIGSLLCSTIPLQVAAGMVITGIVVFFLLPFFRQVLHTDKVAGYLVLTCLSALLQSLYDHTIAYYRARNEAVKFMVACLSAFMTLLVLNLIFLVVFHKGIKGVLMAQIVTYGGLWLFVLLNVLSKTGLGASKQIIMKLLRFSFPLVFAMSGFVVSDVSAVYLLSYFLSLEQVSIYSLGYKIASISGIVLILPFQLAYEPFVYANIKTPGIQTAIANMLTYLMLCFAFIAFGIVFLFRDLLGVIAPPEYYPAYSVIFLILPAMAFRGVYYVGESLLNINKQTQFVGTTVAVTTVISVILNYILIQLWGMYGAIVVFNFMLISTALVLMIRGTKCFPIPIEWRRLGTVAIFLASFLLLVFSLREANHYAYYSITLVVACGSLAFFYFGSFCDTRERMAIGSLVQGIQSKLFSLKARNIS